jgi:hypothetical protein
VRAALQLAGLGFFVKELNVGWREWEEHELPTHAQAVAFGELRCTCSDAWVGSGASPRP